MSDSDWIFQELASGIRALVEKFIEAPFFFYSEQDMHAYLYHKLISGRLGHFPCKTCFGDKTVLLHREYPTLGRYPALQGRRGHFDLVIIDPNSESHWRKRIKPPPYSEHKPKAALEFGLNEIGSAREIGTPKMELKHFKKDLWHLTDKRNNVERGYLLFFVRREDYRKKAPIHPVIDRLPDVLKREVDESQEPTTNLVVLYLESLSPGSSRKEVIPKDRSAWVGF